MSCKELSRKRVNTSKPMKDGLGNWYRMHDFEVTEVFSESKFEWLTPEQAKALLKLHEERDEE